MQIPLVSNRGYDMRVTLTHSHTHMHTHTHTPANATSFADVYIVYFHHACIRTYIIHRTYNNPNILCWCTKHVHTVCVQKSTSRYRTFPPPIKPQITHMHTACINAHTHTHRSIAGHKVLQSTSVSKHSQYIHIWLFSNWSPPSIMLKPNARKDEVIDWYTHDSNSITLIGLACICTCTQIHSHHTHTIHPHTQ